MTANSIPSSLRDLLAKLEYFAMIERGKKICMNDMTFVDAESWLGAAQRRLGGEGRRNMIMQIDALINDVIVAIAEYRNTDFIGLLINGLARGRNGIINLTVTYSHRPNTVAQLRVCLANIQLQLERNKQHLPPGFSLALPSIQPESTGCQNILYGTAAYCNGQTGQMYPVYGLQNPQFGYPTGTNGMAMNGLGLSPGNFSMMALSPGCSPSSSSGSSPNGSPSGSSPPDPVPLSVTQSILAPPVPLAPLQPSPMSPPVMVMNSTLASSINPEPIPVPVQQPVQSQSNHHKKKGH